MEDAVIIDPFQQVSADDYNRFSQFPRDAIDHVVGDIGIEGLGYKGFGITSTVSTKIVVGPGRFYKQGPIYRLTAPYEIDLIDYLPLATRRYLTVVVSGAAQPTNTESRSFVTDVVSRAKVSRPKSTVNSRLATPGVVRGDEAPDPIKKAAQGDQVVVGWVLVDVSGVVSIETNVDARVGSVSSNTARLNENDAWRLKAGSQIDTLRSDLANVAGRINGKAELEQVVLQGYDLARVKELVGLPSVYSAWGSDHFLDLTGTDALNVDMNAKVEEGVRFPTFQIENDQLGLINSLDPNVMTAGAFMLPAYDRVVGISNLGEDAELSIANFAHSTIQMEQKTRARSRVRYGNSFIECTNTSWWSSGRYDWRSGIFYRNGETFQVLSIDNGWGYGAGHLRVRLRRYWTDSVSENYWDAITIPEGVNGYGIAQTFTNTQERFLLEIGLRFSRKANVGDVHVAIVETGDDSSPRPKNAIAMTTISADDIRAGTGLRTPVPIEPTLLASGKYAVSIISGGNHYLYNTINNKFLEGTLFGTTDGDYYAPIADLTKDLAIDFVFAKFRSPRVTVQLQPLSLPGGIVDIDILADTLKPGGSDITFSYVQNGVMRQMNAESSITGLPAGLPFYVTLAGTTAAMPGIGVGANSRVVTTRPGSVMRHISNARVMPSNVTTVRVRTRLEGWRGVGHHTFGVKLRSGSGYSTTTNPASVVDTVAPDDASGNTLIRETFFTFSSPGIGSYKIEFNGTTDSVTACFHVAERVDIGIA